MVQEQDSIMKMAVRFIKYKTGEEMNRNMNFDFYELNEFDIVELTYLVEDKFGIDLSNLTLDKHMTLKEYVDFATGYLKGGI